MTYFYAMEYSHQTSLLPVMSLTTNFLHVMP